MISVLRNYIQCESNFKFVAHMFSRISQRSGIVHIGYQSSETSWS